MNPFDVALIVFGVICLIIVLFDKGLKKRS
jgi:hypothetical protein